MTKYLLLIPAFLMALIGIVGGLLFAGSMWVWEETGMYKYWDWEIDLGKIFK